jgi:ectoine hydroxylase-related dioxygenase (phytanoyl-CoA dioxygenase family)
MATSLRSDRLADASGLPPLTTDVEEAKEHLARYGLARIPNALSPEEVAALLGRLTAQAEAERKAGVAFLESGGANQRIWNLPSKGQVFRDLLTKPQVREFARHLLGDYCLSSHTANIAGPGGEAMVLHSDQGYAPRSIDMPLTMNVMWMLVDFTDENGATRMVPGSHLVQAEPPRDAAPATVAGVGPAGTALVFDGRIWHGTGANVTADSLRYGVLTYFCRPWLRPQENYTLSTHPDVVEAADPELLQLLGFRVWRTLGGVQGPWGPGPPGPTGFRTDGVVRRPTSWIGELQP